MSAEIIEDIKERYADGSTIDITGRPARELIDYVEALEAELAEARKDTERLEWLEQKHIDLSYFPTMGGTMMWSAHKWDGRSDWRKYASNARSAIDAAKGQP